MTAVISHAGQVPNIFANIQLEGLQVLDKTGQDSFWYQIKKLEHPSLKLVKQIEDESATKVVSPIFQLNEKSHFKNIYVFIGQRDDGSFDLVEDLINSNGNAFPIHMHIVKIEKNKMDLIQGPQDDRSSYTAVLKNGNMFP